jgi:cytochrome c-type biogenesis protein CcmF
MIFLGASLLVLALITVIMYKKSKIGGAVSYNEPKVAWSFKTIDWVLVVFMVMAAIVFGGTAYPIFGGETSMDFYDYTFGSLGIVLLLLTAVCPGILSKKTASLIPGGAIGFVALILPDEVLKCSLFTKLGLAVCLMLIVNIIVSMILNREKIFSNRMYLTFILLHVSVALIALGVVGSKGITGQIEKVIAKGETVMVSGYSLTYKDLGFRQEPGKSVAIATLDVTGPKGYITLKPESAYYHKREMHHARAVIKPGAWEDLYIIFGGVDENNNVLLKIMVLKWVSLVWLGSLMLILVVLVRFGFKRSRMIQG